MMMMVLKMTAILLYYDSNDIFIYMNIIIIADDEMMFIHYVKDACDNCGTQHWPAGVGNIGGDLHASFSFNFLN